MTVIFKLAWYCIYKRVLYVGSRIERFVSIRRLGRENVFNWMKSQQSLKSYHVNILVELV